MVATHPSARGALLRILLLFTPFLGVALIGLGFLIRNVAAGGTSGGEVVGLVLVGFVAALLGYQVVQSLRDLFAGLVETTGVVERRWSRNDLFLFRSHYLFVGGTVFRLEPGRLPEVGLGDTVRIIHYPHTGTVEAIEVVGRGEERSEVSGRSH